MEPGVVEALFAEPAAARCLAREDGRIVRHNAEWSRYLSVLDPTFLPVDVPIRLASASELRVPLWTRGPGAILIPPHRPRSGHGPLWEGTLTWVSEGGLRMVLVSLHEDHSAQSAIESALRLGEERLRKTLEYAHAGVFEWDIATDRVFWSPENFELYGVPLSETPSYVLWRSRVHPADRDRVERAVHDAVSGMMPACEVEFRALRPRGGVRWLYSKGEVRRSVDGRPLQMRGLNIDITRRKEIELQLQANQASLQESEARFRALVSSVKDYAIFMLDPAGRIETWNAGAEQIKGYSAEEIIGEHLSRFYTPEDLARGLPATLLAQAACDGRVEIEGWRVRKDGSRFWADVVITRLLDDRGRLMGFTKVTRDVTARKKAELELREADRRNSDFIAVLSHELRNPLAPIRNSLVLLERTPPGTVAHLRARDVLVRQTEQLSRLVDDLLDIGRLTHGKIVLQPTRLDAAKVVRASCDALGPLFEDRGVLLELEESPEPSWVEADRERLGQMVGNLLNNALKFTPPAGLVSVRVAPVGDRCEIHVRDTGAGIHPADLDRIFEPFVQGARAAESHGGMGVGLSLVKELASRQGGSVHVSSEGHGKGAEFVIALPRAAPADVPILERSQRARLQPLQVFLVEDNEDSARSLADLLELDGHTVEIFPEPAAALEVLPKRQPALLICDIGLPGMTGYDFIRTVRQAEWGASLFAVAMTGYAQPEDRLQAAYAGFDAHLAKPPSFDELASVLLRASEGQAARQASAGRDEG